MVGHISEAYWVLFSQKWKKYRNWNRNMPRIACLASAGVELLLLTDTPVVTLKTSELFVQVSYYTLFSSACKRLQNSVLWECL